MNYIKTIIKKFVKESTNSLKVQSIKPVRKDANKAEHYGASMDLDTARKLAIHLLVASETTDSEISVYIDKKDNTIYVQNEDKSYHKTGE